MRALRAILCALAIGGCSAPNVAMTCQFSACCPSPAAQIQTCCSTTQCEYRYGERVVPCNGVDCTAASQIVLTECPQPDAGLAADAAVDAMVDAAAVLDASGCVR